jgi:N-acetylglucosamine-6-phosphate deacetylase
LAKDGWVASIGHTKAGAEVLDSAYEAGARHLTHFFNAMTGLHHRDPGVVGWAFDKKEATFDIIADGIHVHPSMLRFAIKSKGVDNVSLISDSIAPTGLGDGEYEVWGEKIGVAEGRTSNSQGAIAGSVITVDKAVGLIQSVGFSADEVGRMSSANPARLLGLSESHGSLETGKRLTVHSRQENEPILSLWDGILQSKRYLLGGADHLSFIRDQGSTIDVKWLSRTGHSVSYQCLLKNIGRRISQV